MRKPAIAKRRGGAAPPSEPETPAGIPAAPSPQSLPAPLPSAPLPVLDQEGQAILAEIRAELRALRQLRDQPQTPALTPAMLAAIEDRAVERLATLTLTVMKRVTEAAAAAETLPGRIEAAGAEGRRQIIATTEEARASLRNLGVETRAEVEAVHKTARVEMKSTQARALAWTKRLSHYAQSQLSRISQTAAGRMNAATGEARKAAGSLAQAATAAQKVGDGIQGTVMAVEAAAVTIMDMSPVNTRAAEIQARAIARETGLVMLTGLALLIVCAGAAVWRFALTL